MHTFVFWCYFFRFDGYVVLLLKSVSFSLLFYFRGWLCYLSLIKRWAFSIGLVSIWARFEIGVEWAKTASLESVKVLSGQ